MCLPCFRSYSSRNTYKVKPLTQTTNPRENSSINFLPKLTHLISEVANLSSSVVTTDKITGVNYKMNNFFETYYEGLCKLDINEITGSCIQEWGETNNTVLMDLIALVIYVF